MGFFLIYFLPYGCLASEFLLGLAVSVSRQPKPRGNPVLKAVYRHFIVTFVQTLLILGLNASS